MLRVDGETGVQRLRLIGVYLLVQAVAVAAAPRLAADGVSYGSGGSALVPLAAGMVVGTVAGVAVAKRGLSPRLFRVAVVGSFGVGVWFATAPLAGVVLSRVFAAVAGGVAAVAGVAVTVWSDRQSVRNAVTAVGTGGVAALFAASLSPPFAVAAALAATGYDALAVYVLGHMQRLAAVSQRLELPTVFVVGSGGSSEADSMPADADSVPSESDSTLPDAESLSPDADSTRPNGVVSDSLPAENDTTPVTGSVDTPAQSSASTLLLGTGDALFPAIVTASVATQSSGLGVAGVVASAGGGLAGLLALQRLVARGDTHAGLPFVVGGTLVGLLTVVVV